MKKKSLSKNLLLTTALSAMLLSACTEEDLAGTLSPEAGAEGNDTEVESVSLTENYPEGVQNGTVSKEYYEEIVSYLNENNTRIAQLGEHIKGMSDYTILTSNEFKNEFSQFSTDYEVYLKGVQLHPITEADIHLNDLVEDAVMQMQGANSYLYDYVNKSEAFYMDWAKDQMKEHNSTYTALVNLTVEYQISQND